MKASKACVGSNKKKSSKVGLLRKWKTTPSFGRVKKRKEEEDNEVIEQIDEKKLDSHEETTTSKPQRKSSKKKSKNANTEERADLPSTKKRKSSKAKEILSESAKISASNSQEKGNLFT